MDMMVYVAVAVYDCNCNWIDMGVDVDADRRYGVGIVTHWAAHACMCGTHQSMMGR